jgi:hypothetical protein
MIFNYDLAKQNCSFDFVVFLALCEQSRIQNAASSFYVYISPDVAIRYKEANFDWKWRIAHLLFPLALMMPNCRGVGIGLEGSNLSYNLLELDVNIYRSGKFGYIRAGEFALENSPTYDNVITFRERSLHPLRNSNKKAWWSAFNGSNDLFIQDNETELSIENINVELRMAIYQKAGMNWLVSNGCGALCILNPNIKYKIFKIETPEYRPTSLSHIRHAQGTSRGDSPRIANEGQKYIWQEDTYENIKREKEAEWEPIWPARI